MGGESVVVRSLVITLHGAVSPTWVPPTGTWGKPGFPYETSLIFEEAALSVWLHLMDCLLPEKNLHFSELKLSCDISVWIKPCYGWRCEILVSSCYPILYYHNSQTVSWAMLGVTVLGVPCFGYICAVARPHVAQHVLLGWCETITSRVCLELYTQGGLCLCLWPVYLGFRWKLYENREFGLSSFLLIQNWGLVIIRYWLTVIKADSEVQILTQNLSQQPEFP